MKYIIEHVLFTDGERVRKISEPQFIEYMGDHNGEDFNSRDIEEFKKLSGEFSIYKNYKWGLKISFSRHYNFGVFKFEDEWFIVLQEPHNKSPEFIHYYLCDGLDSVIRMLKVILKK